jgi:hypothetical protein
MKRWYLLILSCFLVGVAMAQRTSSNTNVNARTRKNDSQVSSTTTTTKPTTSITALPGFPVYQNTGNKEQDDANYAAAKRKWKKENPELYKDFIKKSGTNENKPTTAIQRSKKKDENKTDDK